MPVAPMDSALILRMEEQHERIAELYKRAADNSTAFAATADVHIDLPALSQDLVQEIRA